jgi:hypothetical protein
MGEHPDIPGPGEHNDSDSIQAESNSGPVPTGDIYSCDPRRTQELPAVVTWASEGEQKVGEDLRRRTGTDLDALRPVRVKSHATEQRLDRSAPNNQREISLDPVHDDSGPQSDQC